MSPVFLGCPKLGEAHGESSEWLSFLSTPILQNSMTAVFSGDSNAFENRYTHALKFLIFGSDMSGRKSYLGLKRQIQNFQVDFTIGIKKWAARIDDFQSYLPHMLWEAGAKGNQAPTMFNEQDLREILEGCLNKYHLSKLTHIDWDLSEQSYRESISKLESIEREIINTPVTLGITCKPFSLMSLII